MRRFGCTVFAAVLMLAMLPTPSLAQDEVVLNARALPFQFNFAPPGARATAMGNAFIAIADDATAAEANPAGLVILPAMEVSAHLRVANSDNPRPTLSNTSVETFPETVVNPSFFSFVYPFGNAAFSVYYQQPMKQRVMRSQTEIIDEFAAGQDLTGDTSLRTFGFSGAYQFHDMVSVGASLRFESVDVAVDELTAFAFGGGLALGTGVFIDDSDTAVTANVGVLVNPGGTFSAGFVYKRGAAFELPGVVLETALLFGEFIVLDERPAVLPLKVPDVIGGGVAGRWENLQVGLDIVYVTYSDLENVGAGVGENDEPYEDATEIHFGGQYVFPRGQNQFFARAGVFTNPDHDGLRTIDTGQTHFTFGGGATLQNRYQMDAAFNIGEYLTEFVLSGVVSF